jgi:hypothetical protein
MRNDTIRKQKIEVISWAASEIQVVQGQLLVHLAIHSLKGPTDIAQTTFLPQATDIASKSHARPCPIDSPCSYKIFHARLRRDWTQRSSVSYPGHVPKRKQRRKCWRRCDFEQAPEKEVAMR